MYSFADFFTLAVAIFDQWLVTFFNCVIDKLFCESDLASLFKAFVTDFLLNGLNSRGIGIVAFFYFLVILPVTEYF